MGKIEKLIRQYEREYKKGNFEKSKKIANTLDKEHKVYTTYAIDLIYFFDSNLNVLYSFGL